MKKLDKNILKNLILETIEESSTLSEGRKKKQADESALAPTPLEANVAQQADVGVPQNMNSSVSLEEFIEQAKKMLDTVRAQNNPDLLDILQKSILQKTNSLVKEKFGVNDDKEV